MWCRKVFLHVLLGDYTKSLDTLFGAAEFLLICYNAQGVGNGAYLMPKPRVL